MYFRKPIITILILIFFIIILSDHIHIDILKNDSILLKPVLDNDSYTDLPFYFYDFNIENLEDIIIDSYNFLSPVLINKPVYNFYGNYPLSLKYEEKKTIYKGDLSAYIIDKNNNSSIKIMPYYKENDNYYINTELDIYYRTIKKSVEKDNSIYDYLIICTQEYDSAFEKFKNWKIRQGYKTKIYTVEHIDSNYTGIDLQEKIRNFIINEYNTNNIQYVMLCGDSTLIPVRKMYALTCGAGYYYDEDSIPADMYYFNLEGNFNSDNDNTYGEIYTDNPDLTPEVYGGRVQFDTIYFGPSPNIDRMIAYEQTLETDYLDRGMFIGMIMWDPPYTPGGDGKDIIKNEIIPDYYHIKTFYESQGHTGKDDILDSLNNGYGIINHAGHGSYKGIWIDDNSADVIGRGDALAMANGNKTGLFYSIGCWVGAFDKEDGRRNFAGCLQMGEDGGCTAIIANSRYGWGAPGYPGWGVSDLFDYKFFQLLFNEDNKEVGYLLAKTKEYFAPYANEENLYLWHLYEINLFGDPSMFIHTKIPDTIYVRKQIIDSTLRIYTYDKKLIPINNLLVCLSENDSIIDRGKTSNGFIELQSSENDTNLIYLTISGPNYITILDSFYIDSINRTDILCNYNKLYCGVDNYLYLKNLSTNTININLYSNNFDTNFSIDPFENETIKYYSDNKFDTLFINYNSKIDSYFLQLFYPINLDKIEINNGKLYTKFYNLSGLEPKYSISYTIFNTDTYYDTILNLSLDSTIILDYINIDYTENYLMGKYSLISNDDIIETDSLFLSNSQYCFYDNFTNGLDNWEYDSMWFIYNDSLLHCGIDSTYLPNMNSQILSKEFYIYPGSVCSINLYFDFPILEFDSNGPVYDLDGVFIKLISENDTNILDFISSGGALKNQSKNNSFNGWKLYNTNYKKPEKVRLCFDFVSDYYKETGGIFINNIKIFSKYYYIITDTIFNDNTDINIYRLSGNIVNNNVMYYIPNPSDNMKIYVYSIDGRLIKKKEYNYINRISINLNDIASGNYFIKIINSNYEYKDRIVLIK